VQKGNKSTTWHTPNTNDPTKAAQSLIDTGIVIVRDPRVNENDNNNFLDLMVHLLLRCNKKKNRQPKQTSTLAGRVL